MNKAKFTSALSWREKVHVMKVKNLVGVDYSRCQVACQDFHDQALPSIGVTGRVGKAWKAEKAWREGEHENSEWQAMKLARTDSTKYVPFAPMIKAT